VDKAKLDAVGIVVSDLARALAFYRVLGVEFPQGAENSEHGHADVELESGVRFMIDTEEEMRKFDPSWQRGKGSPATAVAFHCADPASVDQLFQKALEAGGKPHKEPWDAFWGQRYAQLRDPDGNAVDLYSEQPRSQ
jgi:uncharacterized glyoxalase superfamily protein PhnB